jgi:hypothetical protein
MVTWADKDLTVYFDDSGTHKESKIALAAVCVSTVEQWTKFEEDWKRINDRENFGVMHCADYYSHRKPFDRPEWNDRNKWDRTLRRCIGISDIRTKYGSIRAVRKDDYDSTFGKDEIALNISGRYHYTFAVQACLVGVKRFKDQYFPKAKVKYIFDRMSEGKGEIIWLMEQMIRDYDGIENFGMVPFEQGGYSFESKADVVQLQSSDLLAWHGNRHAQDKYILGNRLRRSPYMRLLLNTKKVETGIYFRDTLTKMSDGLRQSERYKELKEKIEANNSVAESEHDANAKAKAKAAQGNKE